MNKNKFLIWYDKHKEAIMVISIAILIITQPIHQIFNGMSHRTLMEHELKVGALNHQELCHRIQNLEMVSKGFIESGKKPEPCNFLLPPDTNQ